MGYPYSYADTYSTGGSALGAVALFLYLAAFVAAIVLTVIVYRKFVSNKVNNDLKFNSPEWWSKILRFDKLIIGDIIRVLYLYIAISLATFACAAVLAILFSGNFGGFLLGLIFGAILLVILEVIVRVSYEYIMLQIVIAQNTSDINAKLTGKSHVADIDSADLGTAEIVEAPVSPVVEVPEAPKADEAPEADEAPKADEPKDDDSE